LQAELIFYIIYPLISNLQWAMTRMTQSAQRYLVMQCSSPL